MKATTAAAGKMYDAYHCQQNGRTDEAINIYIEAIEIYKKATNLTLKDREIWSFAHTKLSQIFTNSSHEMLATIEQRKSLLVKEGIAGAYIDDMAQDIEFNSKYRIRALQREVDTLNERITNLEQQLSATKEKQSFPKGDQGARLSQNNMFTTTEKPEEPTNPSVDNIRDAGIYNI